MTKFNNLYAKNFQRNIFVFENFYLRVGVYSHVQINLSEVVKHPQDCVHIVTIYSVELGMFSTFAFL